MWKAFEGECEGEGEGEDVGWSLWSPWVGMGNTRQRSMVASAQHYWSISGSIYMGRKPATFLVWVMGSGLFSSQ